MAVFMRYVLILCLYIQSYGSDRVRRGYCSTRNLDISNGNYTLRSGYSVAEFTCNDGFQLYGVERAVCFGSKWSRDPPICIANTCKEILPTSTLRIVKEFDGAVLKFSCAALFKLKGEKTLVCDGTDWSAPTPSCLSWTPPISCDFEDPEMCGWSHHDKDDQDWRWNTGETTSTRTGPSHDHTLGSGGEGHYMYFETSDPTKTNHTAVLLSPLYPADYSTQRCFTFWYHILGTADIGDLEVYFKPESVTDLKTLKPVFHVNEDGGDVWYNKSIRIPSQKEPFQILLVGTRGTSYRSDFAVDDVSLEQCKDTSPHVSSATPSKTTHSSKITAAISTTKMVTRPSTTRTTKQTTVPTTTTTQPNSTTISTIAMTEEPSKKTTAAQASNTNREITDSRKVEQTTTSDTIQTDTGITETSQSRKTLEPNINPHSAAPKKEKLITGTDTTSHVSSATTSKTTHYSKITAAISTTKLITRPSTTRTTKQTTVQATTTQPKSTTTKPVSTTQNPSATTLTAQTSTTYKETTTLITDAMQVKESTSSDTIQTNTEKTESSQSRQTLEPKINPHLAALNEEKLIPGEIVKLGRYFLNRFKSASRNVQINIFVFLC